MAQKDHSTLERELEQAQKKVKVGGIYSHYKSPDKLYKVVELGIQEATEGICVIYQAQYNKKLFFVRDIESWLSEPSNGTLRFKLAK